MKKYRVLNYMKMALFGIVIIGMIVGLVFTIHYALNRDYSHSETKLEDKENSNNSDKVNKQDSINNENEVLESVKEPVSNTNISNTTKEEQKEQVNNIVPSVEDKIDKDDIEIKNEVVSNQYSSDLSLKCSIAEDEDNITLLNRVVVVFGYDDLLLKTYSSKYFIKYPKDIEETIKNAYDEAFDSVIYEYAGASRSQEKFDYEYNLRFYGTIDSMKGYYPNEFKDGGLFSYNVFKAKYESEGYICFLE